MSEVRTKVETRIGVVARDPLRILGLKAIFTEGMQVEIVQVSVPGVLKDAALSLILIDQECTGHLLELIAMFRQLRPQLKLIVLGGDADEKYIERIIGAGAKGYIPLNAKESEIRMAIDMVSDGSVWAPRRVLSRLLDSQALRDQSPEARPKFTEREVQVLRLLRAGRGNREIADSLGIDQGTVKAHIGRLMRKVGVSNRIALTVHPFTQQV